MKKVLGLDGGYGHSKIFYGTSDGAVTKVFKFPTVIGVTKKNEHVVDSRIYQYKDHYYYVGEDTKHLPSENLIDIADYKNLEYYGPLLMHHAIKLIGETPDVIVAGLSIAQINNSGHYQESLKNYTVDGVEYNHDDVFILPQSAGSKIFIDKYENYPEQRTNFLGSSTYVIVDLGFNTVDLAMVSNGKTSPSLFEAVEREGVMKIATLVAQKVKELHGRSIGLHEAKDIIDTGTYSLRGQKHAFKDYVDEVKKDYLKNLLALIENKYGKILDKADFIQLCGGGSAIFKSTADGFIKVPNGKNEYFNAGGFYLYAIIKANEAK